MEILMLGIWGMCGWACYSIAESKKRNKEVWAVLGVLFGFIAVIIISVRPLLARSSNTAFIEGSIAFTMLAGTALILI